MHAMGSREARISTTERGHDRHISGFRELFFSHIFRIFVTPDASVENRLTRRCAQRPPAANDSERVPRHADEFRVIQRLQLRPGQGPAPVLINPPAPAEAPPRWLLRSNCRNSSRSKCDCGIWLDIFGKFCWNRHAKNPRTLPRCAGNGRLLSNGKCEAESPSFTTTYAKNPSRSLYL